MDEWFYNRMCTSAGWNLSVKMAAVLLRLDNAHSKACVLEMVGLLVPGELRCGEAYKWFMSKSVRFADWAGDEDFESDA